MSAVPESLIVPCSSCGTIRIFSNIYNARTARRNKTLCKICAIKIIHNSKTLSYRGDVLLMWVNHKRLNAKRRGIEWELTPEALQRVYDKQGKVCALTSLPIGWGKHEHSPKKTGRRNTYSVSIDRIDSNKPYVEENIQLVHKHANVMKQKLPMKEFVHFCKLVYLTNKHLVDD